MAVKFVSSFIWLYLNLTVSCMYIFPQAPSNKKANHNGSFLFSIWQKCQMLFLYKYIFFMASAEMSVLLLCPFLGRGEQCGK